MPLQYTSLQQCGKSFHRERRAEITLFSLRDLGSTNYHINNTIGSSADTKKDENEWNEVRIRDFDKEGVYRSIRAQQGQNSMILVMVAADDDRKRYQE